MTARPRRAADRVERDERAPALALAVTRRSTRGRRRRTRSRRRRRAAGAARTRWRGEVDHGGAAARRASAPRACRPGVIASARGGAREADRGERAHRGGVDDVEHAAARRVDARAVGRGGDRRSRRPRAPRARRRRASPRSIAVTLRPAATYAREPSEVVATARARPGSATRAVTRVGADVEQRGLGPVGGDHDDACVGGCGGEERRSARLRVSGVGAWLAGTRAAWRGCGVAAGARQRRLGGRGFGAPWRSSGTGSHRYSGQPRPTRIRSGRTCLPTQPPLTFAGAHRDRPPLASAPREPATAPPPPRPARRHLGPARRRRAAEPRSARRSRCAARSSARAWAASSSSPTGDEARAARTVDVVVWDGASLAGPRDVLDGAWLALRPEARAMIEPEAGGKLLLIAPPPLRRRRRGGARRRSRTSRARCRSSGRATASAPPRCCPARRPSPKRSPSWSAFLASRAGRLLLRLRLRPGGGVSERYRVTSLDDDRAAAGPGLAALAAGPPRARDRRLRHQRVRRAAPPATTSSSRTPRRARATRSSTSSPAARRRSRSTARGRTRPAGTYVFLPDPAVRRHAVADEAGHDRAVVRRAARRGVRGLGLGGALPRHRDPRARPRAGAGALRGGAGGRPGGPVGALRPRLLARALRQRRRGARGCSTARSSSAARRCAPRPREDPDLAGLRGA